MQGIGRIVDAVESIANSDTLDRTQYDMETVRQDLSACDTELAAY